jgi:hypothetical protein
LELPFVVKRYRKYFLKEDGSPVQIMARELEVQNTDLLRTIKLQKNVFKLELPSA